MTNGTPFFGARRHSALNAILFIAFPANRTAQFLLLALCANGRNHFVVFSNEKLKIVLKRAFVLFL
jgi:hypothetical protein